MDKYGPEEHFLIDVTPGNRFPQEADLPDQRPQQRLFAIDGGRLRHFQTAQEFIGFEFPHGVDHVFAGCLEFFFKTICVFLLGIKQRHF